jgi:hypothetical protein
MTAPIDLVEIVDLGFAISVNWVHISTVCGCTRTVTIWSAAGSEDRRPVEAEAARWSRILAGALGLDSPLAICDRRRIH